MYEITTLKKESKLKPKVIGYGTKGLSPELKTYFIQVCQLKNEIADIDKTTIELVGNDILIEIKKIGTKEQLEAFYEILECMIRSVRADFLHSYIVNGEKELAELADKAYAEMQKIPQKDFNSPIRETQLKAKVNYYEKVFLKRSFIQNYFWDCHGLAEDAGAFIKDNEKSKLYFKSFNRTNFKGKECMICEEPCVAYGSDICDYCFECDLVIVYIRLCKFFKIMGNFYLFKAYMSDKSLNVLLNDLEFFRWFKIDHKIITIRQYVNYHKLKQSLSKTSSESDIKKEKILLVKREMGREEIKVVNSLLDIGDKTLV